MKDDYKNDNELLNEINKKNYVMIKKLEELADIMYQVKKEIAGAISQAIELANTKVKDPWGGKDEA